jgi:hypothetical protein
MGSPACASELVAVASADAGSKVLAHGHDAGLLVKVLGKGRSSSLDDFSLDLSKDKLTITAAEFSEGLRKVTRNHMRSS